MLAFVAGITLLAGPRRTRPLAGFFYGVGLSRAQGAGLQRLERTIERLFHERESIRRDVNAWRDETDRLGLLVEGDGEASHYTALSNVEPWAGATQILVALRRSPYPHERVLVALSPDDARALHAEGRLHGWRPVGSSA